MSNKLPGITIGIPCYHCHNTLLRTLSSIMMQTIIQDCEVILINDGDEKDYSEFVNMFKPYMKIREIKFEDNVGPSRRQVAVEESKKPLITFIDADDTFANAFALQILRQQLLAEPVNAICCSQFIEEQPNNFIAHPANMVWTFGCLVKKDFLQKYDIRFMPGSRSNEDTGWWQQCKLCANQYEQIKACSDTVYFWHYKEDSITRINNAQYSYDKSFQGYANNMIYAIKRCESKVPFNGGVMQQKVMVMANLYEYLIETYARDKRFYEQNWQCCRKYYAEVYREIKDKISDEIFAEVYASVMKNNYLSDKMFKIIPVMGIRQFMEKLEAEYDPNETEFPMTDDSTPYPEKDPSLYDEEE